MKISSIIFIFFLFVVSCTSEQGKILKQADSVIESRPDSAMNLLENIDRSKLKKSELPYYALLYTQAQVKTDIPLDSDSLISIAYKKYGQSFRGERGLRSNFYLGEVYFNQKRNPQAMRQYLKVYEESKRIENDYWRAKAAQRISDLFFYSYNYDDSERYAQEAADLFKQVNRKTFHRYSLAGLANIYICNGDAERAYLLLDSLKTITLNENPIDSIFLGYLRIPLMEAMAATGKISDRDPESKAFVQANIPYEDPLDVTILKGKIFGIIDKPENATDELSNIQELAETDEEKVHLLYALYENAKALGNHSLVLSLVDSLLLYQNKIAEDIIQESMIGVQRDFYNETAIRHKERSSFFKMISVTLFFVFLLIVAFIFIVVHYRNKVQKERLQMNLESLISLRTYSANILLEKETLLKSVKEKEALIEDLTERIKVELNKIKSLKENISKKDLTVYRLETILQNKEIEFEDIRSTLKEKENEYDSLKVLLNEKSQKEITQAQIVERLFKEKWSTLDMLCNQYFSLNNSELTEKNILDNIQKEVKRLASKKGLSEIIEATEKHMGGIVTAVRQQCTFLKEEDICFLTLTYAGFSARSVCLFTGIKYKHYYVKKARLIERIKKSNAPDKELFISKMK